MGKWYGEGMSEVERIPAEVFPPGEFIREEMDARGWSAEDLAERFGGDYAIDLLVVNLCLHVHDTSLILGRNTAEKLGRAFGVSPEFFLNLDTMWRRYGPPSKHATAH